MTTDVLAQPLPTDSGDLDLRRIDAAQQVPIVGQDGRSATVPDGWFDLTVTIVTDDACAQSTDCDTSDGCSSTCPSACAST
jgi:FxLD family lantipeptide